MDGYSFCLGTYTVTFTTDITWFSFDPATHVMTVDPTGQTEAARAVIDITIVFVIDSVSVVTGNAF